MPQTTPPASTCPALQSPSGQARSAEPFHLWEECRAAARECPHSPGAPRCASPWFRRQEPPHAEPERVGNQKIYEESKPRTPSSLRLSVRSAREVSPHAQKLSKHTSLRRTGSRMPPHR